MGFLKSIFRMPLGGQRELSSSLVLRRAVVWCGPDLEADPSRPGADQGWN
jgi:hypothetical protein